MLGSATKHPSVRARAGQRGRALQWEKEGAMRSIARAAFALSLAFALSPAHAGALHASPHLVDNGDGTLTDGRTGLVWVADPRFAVTVAGARKVRLPLPEAVAVIAAMNRGDIENFGRRDWRLPTERELRGVENGGTARRAKPRNPKVWPVAGAAALSGVGDAVILATNSVHVNRNSVIAGDVVVNDASSGPTLTGGVELAIDRDTVITGSLRGDSVILQRDLTVSGTVSYNQLTSATGVTTGGLVTPLGLPVFSLLPPFQTANPHAGAPDVTVGAGQTLTLPAGDYGHVHVAATGQLILSGGVYELLDLTVAGLHAACSSCRAVRFAGPSDLRIAGRLSVGKHASLLPDATVAVSSNVLYVGGVNGLDGRLGSSPKAAAFDRESVLGATLYAPHGTTQLDRETRVTGALLGRDVLVARNAELQAASYFANRAPIADPQTVETAGAAPITIVLTGSDADGDNLTFSISEGPQTGTLGAITPIPPPPPDPEAPNAPQQLRASVVYTPDGSDDVEDSFIFQVADPLGATGQAVVSINPPGDDEPPPPPPTTVIAFDATDQTFVDTAVTLTLEGDAPDGVALSFAIVAGSGPESGTLGPLLPGSESPARTATVVYTPSSGFEGGDGFDFEACGTIDLATVCDTAAVTINVAPRPAEPSELAPDLSASVSQDRALQITLGEPTGTEAATAAAPLIVTVLPAAVLHGAAVAGNVADADENGAGDNHNVLPGPAPVFVSAAVDQVGGAGSQGTARIHIEWDVSSFAGSQLESAHVRLHTHRGTVDALDTFFFTAAAGNGTLDDADFATAMESVAGAVMPVPPLEDLPIGADGTFSFDVTPQVQSALDAAAGFFSVQGRVNEALSGPARGLEVRSSASGNLASFLEPQLELATPGVVAPTITFTILTLPLNGILRDSGGQQILDVPHALVDARVSYTPSAGFTGSDGFGYQAQDDTITDGGLVFILVQAGNCALDPSFCDDGRESSSVSAPAVAAAKEEFHVEP
jgi:hypothetical protein